MAPLGTITMVYLACSPCPGGADDGISGSIGPHALVRNHPAERLSPRLPLATALVRSSQANCGGKFFTSGPYIDKTFRRSWGLPGVLSNPRAIRNISKSVPAYQLLAVLFRPGPEIDTPIIVYAPHLRASTFRFSRRYCEFTRAIATHF